MATDAQKTMLDLLGASTDEQPIEKASPEKPNAVITPQLLQQSLPKLSTQEMQTMVGMLNDRLQEVAIQNADLEAITEKAFSEMFNRYGVAHEPQIYQGLLICAGSHRKPSSSSQNHECEFVCVNQQWVWDESLAPLVDDMRRIPIGTKEHLRAITIIPASEGDTVDYVGQKYSRQTGHKPKRKISYIVKNGQLEVTNTRETPAMTSHF